MDEVQEGNLDTHVDMERQDEFGELAENFNIMTKRISSYMEERVRREKELNETQIAMMQSQLNPHFLYNVLNVISSRGIMDGDEEICEICGCLAAMLRYSTNTKERYATVEKELEYLERYIFLLKSRYEHRLEVEVECEESVKHEQLPKIVLQQLVENSIQHGYNNSKKYHEKFMYVAGEMKPAGTLKYGITDRVPQMKYVKS
mgnify:CR=1 FL=1